MSKACVFYHVCFIIATDVLLQALLPLQTDPMISSLSRMPKTIKPSSPTADSNNGKISSSTKPQQIDVRTIALQLFRDQIIYPIFPILHDCLTEMKDHFLGGDLGYQQPRLQQMYVRSFYSSISYPNSLLFH